MVTLSLATPRRNALLRRWAMLAVGLPVLVGGVAMTIAAGLGVGSWQVFELALADRTGLALGTVIVVESVVALAIAWAWLGQVPGPATLVLGLGAGPYLEWTLGWLPAPTTVLPALGLLLAGSALVAVGVGLYIPAELGPSAQDALFVGIYRRYDLRPGWVRFGTDFTLVGVGWLLGGPIGLGTVVVTFLIPALVDVTLPWGHRLAGTPARADDHPVTATPV